MVTKSSNSKKVAAAKLVAKDMLEQVKKKPSETQKRLGLNDPKEALLCLPARYADTSVVLKDIPSDNDELSALYELKFTGEMAGFDRDKRPVDLSGIWGWRSIFRLQLGMMDSQGRPVDFSVFGMKDCMRYKDLSAGEVMHLVGKVQYFNQGTKYERAFLKDVEHPPARAIGSIWVQYLGIPGRVSGEKVQEMVLGQLDNPDAFGHCATKLIGAIGLTGEEAMEIAEVSDRYRSFEDVLSALHRPNSVEDGLAAKRAANKLSAMAVQAAALRHNIRYAHPDAPMNVDVKLIAMLAKTQKESMTVSQMEVATQIASKLRAPKPMNALLSGDVGTGKTLAYLLPALAAHQAGAKVCIIAPTAILADQIARQIVSRFGTQAKGVQRVVAGGKIIDHDYILVGTPGLASVATKNKYIPNFLICDEQHKLSTDVRERLIRPWTHTLEVTATPVPRSLASALFGGKDILNLRECPVKKEFNCYVGDVSMRPKFSSLLKSAIDRGERAAVIYPLVESQQDAGDDDMAMRSKESERQSVLSGAKALESAFPGKVVAIYGSMKDEDIAAAIEQVRSGEKPLVVASTVIETGVDIPGITAMVVRDADYFGISQLHQLRGRLVRNGGVGEFAMMVQDMSTLAEDTLARLRAIESSTDGYELAERDLLIRGIGDLAGDAQSGASSETVFKLGKLRAEDFLRKKMGAEREPQKIDPESESDRPAQPRLIA
jgi:ATP-dependent DNA helicase RecG